ncbi:phosphoserine phosphatase SerB [Moraxella haemolytica]|uniref:phosphoserine phosphatase SerB n=1 Tax=Moraxella haemolytica TaxID=2904119 RepID=UPI0025431B43|nr:phosphoserine phosphatase SerB [Moraxella sp. ZY171148]WII95713.1 phosphoserine phosphatase SerB [Moraxella sp. ZY171148]
MSITYALPKHSQAWQNALNSVANVLPIGMSITTAPLEQLPIFAIVVVVKRPHGNVDSLIQAWVDTQANWQAIIVHDDENAKTNAHLIEVQEPLADVSVHRYLLAQAQCIQMSDGERKAATHIIDEQLSTYLADRLDNDADVHILSVGQVLHDHRLACFDMDSTLIEQEVIVEIARFCGIEDKVLEITEQAMRGEIDFATSFARRVALLEGVLASVIDEIIAKRITFSSGAYAAIKALKALGYHTVLISGGFTPFAQYVAQTLGIDEYHANTLSVLGDELTGQIDDNIIDGNKKAAIVAKIANAHSLGMHQVVCVGDGANDLPMMHISDIGIAYHAKPIVKAKADAAINITGLEGVLYALGHRFDVHT